MPGGGGAAAEIEEEEEEEEEERGRRRGGEIGHKAAGRWNRKVGEGQYSQSHEFDE